MSRDCTIALQSGDRVRLYLKKISQFCSFKWLLCAKDRTGPEDAIEGQPQLLPGGSPGRPLWWEGMEGRSKKPPGAGSELGRKAELVRKK